MFPVRLRKRLMDLAYPAWFMWCASSLLDESISSFSLVAESKWFLPALLLIRSCPGIVLPHERCQLS